MFLGKKKSPKLALAVRDDSLFAVERSSQRKSAISLQAWAVQSLHPGIVQKGKLIKPGQFKQALRRLLTDPDHGQFSTSTAHLVLPESLVKHHIGTVKTKSPEYSRAIFHEAMLRLAHRYGPKRIMKGDTEKHDDIWVHSSHSYAEQDYLQYELACKEVGLSLQSCSSSGQAASAFYFIGKQAAEPLLWIHIGEKQSEFVLMDGFGIYQSDTLASGVKHLSSQLQSQLGNEKQQSEAFLEHIGFRSVKKSFQQEAVLSTWKEQLVRNAKALQLLSKQHHDNNLAILLCGEGALIAGLGEELSHDLQIHLRSLRGWAQLNPLPDIKTYHQLIPALGAMLS